MECHKIGGIFRTTSLVTKPLQSFLINGAAGKDFSQELSSVMHLYSGDIDDQLLSSQFVLHRTQFRDHNTTPNLMNMVNFVRPI